MAIDNPLDPSLQAADTIALQNEPTYVKPQPMPNTTGRLPQTGPETGVVTATKDIAENDWFIPQAWHWLQTHPGAYGVGSMGDTFDPTFRLPKETSPEGKKLYEGIPESMRGAFDSAVSMKNALNIRQHLLERAQRAKAIQKAGAWVAPLRFGVDMVDPTFLPLMVSSAGTADLVRGGILAKTAAAAGEGAAFNSVLSAAQQEMTQGHLKFANTAKAALWGGVLGAGAGVLHGLMTPDEEEGLNNAANDISEHQELEQTAGAAANAVRNGTAPATKDLKKVAEDPMEWADSIGAARTDPLLMEQTNLAVDPAEYQPPKSEAPHEEAKQSIPQAKFRKARLFSYAKVLRGSANEWVRRNLGILVGDVVGGNGRNAIGTTEVAEKLWSKYLFQLNQTYYRHYFKWAKEVHGAGRWRSSTSRVLRNEFGELVGDRIQNIEPEGGHEHVDGAAEEISKLNDNIRKHAQQAGVSGFETLDPDPNYLTRYLRHREFTDKIKQFGDKKIKSFFYIAMKKGYKDAGIPLENKYIRAMANGYITNTRARAIGLSSALPQAFRGDDLDYLRQMLRDNEVQLEKRAHDTSTYTMNRDKASEQIHELKEAIDALERHMKERSDTGRVSHGRHRVKIDMSYEAHVKDVNGEVHKVRMRDFYQRNAEQIVSRYVRSMGGQIALAETAGIKSIRDWEHRLTEARKRSESRDDFEQAQREIRHAEDAYSYLTGHSLEKNPDSGYARFLRTLRAYQFGRNMGQVGWAHLTNIGNILNKSYGRYVMRYLPEMTKALKLAEDGKVPSTLFHEIMGMFGMGVEFHNNHMFTHFHEDFHDAGGQALLGKIEHASRVSGRFVGAASGLAKVVQATDMMATAAILTRFAESAVNHNEWLAKSLEYMNLDKDMLDRIHQQMLKHTEAVNGKWGKGMKIHSLHLDHWTDYEARDAFENAVRKEATRISQKPEFGASNPLMHSTVGKIMLQFRGWLINSWAHQTLHAVAHPNLETMSSLASTYMLAMASVAGQKYTANFNDPARLKKYMNLEYLMKEGANRFTYAGILPQLIDTLATHTFTENPIFGYRSSGLATDFFSGNPVVDQIVTGGKVFQSMLKPWMEPGYQYSQQDARAAWRSLLFHNLPGMTPLFNEMVKKLPKHSTKDWFMNQH